MKKLEKYKEKIQTAKDGDRIVKLKDLAEQMKSKIKTDRFETGINILDENLKTEKENGGFAGGDIVVVAGPTGNGKTLLSSTICHNVMQSGVPCLYFSYEVNAYNLWKSFDEMEGENEVVFCPMKNTSGNVDWILRKIKEAKDKYYTKVVVVDHLGFLTPSQKYNPNMSQNYSAYITQIVRELKTIAVDEDIIIILPAHVNKAATDNLTLRDIGHSGGIAQESDVVLLVAREESKDKIESYYTKYTKVSLAKNRIGGTTPTFWMEKINGKLKITNYEGQNQSAYSSIY